MKNHEKSLKNMMEDMKFINSLMQCGLGKQLAQMQENVSQKDA